MTQSSATQPTSEPASDKTAIRPFQVDFPKSELTDLRRRINATRWPETDDFLTRCSHNGGWGCRLGANNYTD